MKLRLVVAAVATLAVALAEPRHVLDVSGLNEPPERLWQTDALIALGAALREDS